VQVEPEPGPHAVAQRLQGAALGRLQQQGVAVDVDPLRVPPLEAPRTVGVQHRHHVHGQLVEHPRDGRLLAVAPDVLGHVQQRGGGRGLVAVHLRPEQHVEGSAAEREPQDRAALHRPADLLEREQVLGSRRDSLQLGKDERVVDERRRTVVAAFLEPGSRERLGRERRDEPGLGGGRLG